MATSNQWQAQFRQRMLEWTATYISDAEKELYTTMQKRILKTPAIAIQPEFQTWLKNNKDRIELWAAQRKRS